MVIYLVSFAEGEIYNKSRENLDKTLDVANIDKHIKWDFNKIKQTNFYQKNKKLLDNKIGYGYWSWKPYIILEQLKKLENDDFMIYMDASRYETDGFKNSCLDTIKFMIKNKLDILPGFKTKNRNYEMIKPTCLDFYNLNNNEFKNKLNVFTSPMILRKTNFTLNFIKEWLDGCLIENNVSHHDLSNIGGKIHIYDQAVLNCLLYKYQIKSYEPHTDEELEFRKHTYYFNYFKNILKN